ncbi:SCAN domain-containing protein 3 [Trichonephila clavipes]|nr:SCAN domain-containing protein 3 [Trichonephila clavipes]
MIGGSADIDICKIPISNDTIHRRIKDMSENIEQNSAKTLANLNFALQVNETTDITGNAQLIAFVRFIHENDIINQFLCCRELPDFTTGKHIFQVISSYLEEIKVSLKSCIGICTDGAPAMTGHLKGFVAHVKELNEDILVTHCFLHREALVTKFLPSDLKIVLEQCVKMVNYIKSRPLKSRLFSKLCQAMEAKYESVLLHTKCIWKKIRLQDVHSSFIEHDGFDGYRVFDKTIMFTNIQNFASCKKCGGDIKLSENCVRGLSSVFSIECKNCKDLCSFRNSKMLGKRKNIPEINRRFVYAMRIIGQGHAAMTTFCGVMDFPPPVAEKSYNNIINKLQLCSKEVVEASMQSAALEEVTLTNSSDIIISGDGTWKTRGYSSRVGVCAVIGDKTEKCIDAEVMSSFCKGCDS